MVGKRNFPENPLKIKVEKVTKTAASGVTQDKNFYQSTL